ncbi:hypothetical protein L596_009966 [Steinernema carpocapsae]|uniref:Uncharacterized protein n=1 Tax=Steinernema carpocapsae TaxID=34508 RepID=A0A4U5PHD9_STECR|nr:hypothetical protein L596_009966 [Steinernema carpocapsae]
MDMFALYTLLIVLAILFVTVRRRFVAGKDRGSAEEVTYAGRIKSHIKRRSYQRQSVDTEPLRAMTIEELTSLNRRQMHVTDRYWREIFRRFNNDLPPDNVNLSMLNSRNAITVLQEILPKTGLHAAEQFTIVGTDAKSNSDMHCEVIKYLRKRFTSCTEHQIDVDPDADCVTLVRTK